jgi:mycothiol system anti-sigma-R factor
VGSTGDGMTGLGGGMNCDAAVRELYTYLDGELTEERRLEIADHLDYCSPCSGAAEFEAELRHVIADRCRDRVPDSLIRRVAECIEAERDGRSPEARSGVSAPPG